MDMYLMWRSDYHHFCFYSESRYKLKYGLKVDLKHFYYIIIVYFKNKIVL